MRRKVGGGVTEPFLRWAGGKRWLAATLAPLLAKRLHCQGRYYEPFLGSGAMFFALNVQSATLSDLNGELINAFQHVRNAPTELTTKLARLRSSRKVYSVLRSANPRSGLARAVRFIYLNRHCWGGLYRENQAGRFNVPYGDRTHAYTLKRRLIERASQQLTGARVRLYQGDFARFLRSAGKGDVVYCDPTYREVTRRQFDRYGPDVFDWDDQERLARIARGAAVRGAVVVVSNASCYGVRELYPEAAQISVVRRRGISPSLPDLDRTEYLFVLDPERRWAEWSTLGPILRPSPRYLRASNKDAVRKPHRDSRVSNSTASAQLPAIGVKDGG